MTAIIKQSLQSTVIINYYEIYCAGVVTGILFINSKK